MPDGDELDGLDEWGGGEVLADVEQDGCGRASAISVDGDGL